MYILYYLVADPKTRSYAPQRKRRVINTGRWLMHSSAVSHFASARLRHRRRCRRFRGTGRNHRIIALWPIFVIIFKTFPLRFYREAPAAGVEKNQKHRSQQPYTNVPQILDDRSSR
jgi:hypothetical protein